MVFAISVVIGLPAATMPAWVLRCHWRRLLVKPNTEGRA